MNNAAWWYAEEPMTDEEREDILEAARTALRALDFLDEEEEE